MGNRRSAIAAVAALASLSAGLTGCSGSGSGSKIVDMHGTIVITDFSVADEGSHPGCGKGWDFNVANGAAKVLMVVRTTTPVGTSRIPTDAWKYICTATYSAKVPVSDVYELSMPDYPHALDTLTFNRSDMVSGAAPRWTGIYY